ncbi:YncE family protein, partial [Streptomyces sp. NPDC090445]|uniref:YncE family protein n=1 Tax=Streptomyces sp. NPDC090445 TaxID=3365963 RepID=UPI0038223F74
AFLVGVDVAIHTEPGRPSPVQDTSAETCITRPQPPEAIHLVLAPDGRRLYVSNLTSDDVSVVDVHDGAESDRIPVGDQPAGIGVRPDGRQVYVANIGSDNVSVISTRTRAVTETVAVGDGPNGLAVSPDGSLVHVSNFDSDTLSVIDTSTARTTDTVSVGDGPTGVAAAQRKRA